MRLDVEYIKQKSILLDLKILLATLLLLVHSTATEIKRY